jgi:uncharacterized damage-inducible protein DinB
MVQMLDLLFPMDVGSPFAVMRCRFRDYERINATLGGDADKRQRPLEFDTVSMERRALLDRLDSTLVRALDVIAGLAQADLERTYNVQVYQESGLTIVVHVVEHFSYHVGQITLHTKLMRDLDTRYY